MQFEIGDRVAVLDDVIKGIVVRVDDLMITIKDNTGFAFTYLPNDLVKIEGNQRDLLDYRSTNDEFLQQKKQVKTSKKSLFTTSKNEITLEVDLHIHQLIASTKGMDNFDMLNLQLETARKKLEYAVAKKISKIVFIHGVGEGVLKTELEYLFQKYPVKYYDASYQKYGLGATEVYVFQNPKS